MWYTGIANLKFMIDPRVLENPAFNTTVSEFIGLHLMMEYSQRVSKSGVSIDVYYPEYLLSEGRRHKYHAILPDESHILDAEPVQSGLENSAFRNYIHDKLSSALSEQDIPIYDLCAKIGCHYLVTDNPVLIECREHVEDKYGVIITSLLDMQREAEVFLIGNGIFISRRHHLMGLGASNFYLMTDKKFERYSQLISKIYEIGKNVNVDTYFRAAIYHRYGFMLYASDLIDFHIRQHSFVRHSIKHSPHKHLASYHLNSFYIMLWGLLDNLAWCMNFALNMGFDDANYRDRSICSFHHPAYKSKLQLVCPKLFELVTNVETADWFRILKIKRHPAAHREPIYLSQVLNQEDGSILSETTFLTKDDGARVSLDAISHLKYDLNLAQKFLDDFCDALGVDPSGN